jgi:hypothetical protein
LECTYEEFQLLLEEHPVYHKSSARFAKKIVEERSIGINNLTYHHPPIL